MSSRPLDRRPFLRAAGALIASAALPIVPARAAAARVATPRQTPGPFYPTRFPDDVDNDLVTVAGRSQPAQGRVTHVAGRRRSGPGRPLRGAQVETWQCDVHGRYHHVESSWQTQASDDNFQGYGRTVTDDTGAYAFRTIKPVAYSGRTPHIHFAVSAPDFPRFITQMYVSGEPRNERDGVLMSVRGLAARDRLIVPLRLAAEPGALAGTFDIVLG